MENLQHLRIQRKRKSPDSKEGKEPIKSLVSEKEVEIHALRDSITNTTEDEEDSVLVTSDGPHQPAAARRLPTWVMPPDQEPEHEP